MDRAGPEGLPGIGTAVGEAFISKYLLAIEEKCSPYLLQNC
jgi:hypothetical protein